MDGSTCWFRLVWFHQPSVVGLLWHGLLLILFALENYPVYIRVVALDWYSP